MGAFKQQCIELRRRDLTLPEIVKITGRPKTSVWFHIQDVPLSLQKNKEIANAAKKRITSYSKSIKGTSKKKFKTFNTWNKKNVLMVAHFLFDGQITQGGCIYHNRCPVLIDRVKNCMESIYVYEPKESINAETDVMRIGYYNVALGAYLKEKSYELIDNASTLSPKLKLCFLKAFYDDEGCMDFKARQVRGYQHNQKMLKLIHKLLSELNIESKIDERFNEIIISRKENLIKFRDKINFSPGVRINGKRSNSIWKKDLEKRKILDMAIDSYQS